jgi:adenylate cyclase
MRKFLAELKRRHVYRVAVLYGAVVWLLVQIADVVLENFNLPDRVMQLFIVLAALGFPLVLALAWLYDVRIAGMGRVPVEAESPDDREVTQTLGIAALKSQDDRPGLVVLPFDCFSEQVGHEMVCNGFTEDLTTLLARIPCIFVISRNTAYCYKEHRKDLREIGRELGIRYLLEGSMRHIGDKVRVTAQLIEAETGSHLWADKYDALVGDLPDVQDTMIGEIALRLNTEIARAEFKLARRRHPNDMNAWSLYQSAKGTLMFLGWSKKSIRQAVDQLHQAIELDPEYAPPLAYLSLLLALGHWMKLVDDLPAAHDESMACANRSLELDPNSSEVLGYVGCAYSDLGHRKKGVPILEKAIELDASNAQARAGLGAALIVSGELERGIVALTEAIKISPRDPGLAMWATILAMASGYVGDIKGAEEWSDVAYKSDPHFFPGLVTRSWVQVQQGLLRDAQASLDEAHRLNPGLDASYIAGFLGDDIVEQMRVGGLRFGDQ